MPQGQLITGERHHIAQLADSGWSNTRIANALGRHRGTLWRERKRNQHRTGGYHPETAMKLASERRTRTNQCFKLDHSRLGSAVRLKLIHGWSPEQIAEWLKLQHPDDPAMHVIPETSYRWVSAKVYWQSPARCASSPLTTSQPCSPICCPTIAH